MEQQILQSEPMLDKAHGYYASVTVTNNIEEVRAFCGERSTLEKVLSDLPDGIQNFLNLELESTSGERIVWRNAKTATSGTLTFLIDEDRFHGGTRITAQANFDKIHFREDSPSTLMNIFLRRMKNLIETGEIPTTKGQPSGREELKH